MPPSSVDEQFFTLVATITPPRASTVAEAVYQVTEHSGNLVRILVALIGGVFSGVSLSYTAQIVTHMLA